MPCTTVAGVQPSTEDANIAFGYGDQNTSIVEGIVVTNVKVTNKVDKKEIVGSCGTVIGMHYYNRNSEVEISGYGKATTDVGTKISLTASDLGQQPINISSMIVDEVTYEETNEDFNKSTIKMTCYEDLDA
jgi:hypothetical protein